MTGFSGLDYHNPFWRLQSEPGATDYMEVHFEFHDAGGGDFDRAVLEVAACALAFLGPELPSGISVPRRLLALPVKN
jgi:hypothetical protein